MSSLLIFGAGGHGRVVADAALAAGQWLRVLASDRDPSRCNGELLAGVRPAARLCRDGQLPGPSTSRSAMARPGHAKSPPCRRGCWPPSSIRKPACRGTRALAPGCFIAAQAVVGPNATLGVSVIVNHGAVVDHDVTVGDFSHVAPLAALGGGAKLGRRVLVGSGASVLPGVRVCDDVVIGAGAVVASDLAEPGTYAGVPARRLK